MLINFFDSCCNERKGNESYRRYAEGSIPCSLYPSIVPIQVICNGAELNGIYLILCLRLISGDKLFLKSELLLIQIITADYSYGSI